MTLLQQVRQFLAQDEWEMEEFEPGMLGTRFEGENGEWNFVLGADDGDAEQPASLHIFSVYPDTVPEHRMGLMAEFIARANYDLPLGHFELDFADGELRYKTGILLDSGEQLSQSVLTNLIYGNLVAMDRHYTALGAVILGVAPAKAMASLQAEAEE